MLATIYVGGINLLVNHDVRFFADVSRSDLSTRLANGSYLNLEQKKNNSGEEEYAELITE